MLLRGQNAHGKVPSVDQVSILV